MTSHFGEHLQTQCKITNRLRREGKRWSWCSAFFFLWVPIETALQFVLLCNVFLMRDVSEYQYMWIWHFAFKIWVHLISCCSCLWFSWLWNHQHWFAIRAALSSSGNDASSPPNIARRLCFYNENTGLQLVFLFLTWRLHDRTLCLIIRSKMMAALCCTLCQHC